MWPKLFRRLAEYFASGNVGLSGFDAWIREDIVTRDDAYFCRMANLAICTTYTSWKTIQLRVEPEEVIILPDDA
jgi:hypothetical protein